MPFIQDDHVVQAFAPHAADQAFHIRILPRASWRRDDLFHAHRHHRRAERLPTELPVCAVPVADQIARCRVPRKGFADLLCHPIRARMCSDAKILDAPPLMTQHNEYEQNGERGRRDHKEIDRNETAHVVVEERPPGLRRRLPIARQVFRHGRLGNVEAELQRLPMEPWSAPQRVLAGHPSDEVSDFPRNRRSARLSSSRFPGPEKLEALSVPADDGLGFHDHKGLAPAGPHAGQRHPKQAVGHAEGGPGRFPLHDSQLLAQSKVLQMQRHAAEESLTDHGKDDLKGGLHIGDAKRHRSEMLGFPRRTGFIGATGFGTG